MSHALPQSDLIPEFDEIMYRNLLRHSFKSHAFQRTQWKHTLTCLLAAFLF